VDADEARVLIGYTPTTMSLVGTSK